MDAAQKGKVFTIGHSTHEFERFVELLKLHRIEAVGDVRSVPYSRWRPQFNKEDLGKALKGQGMAYVFLGRGLGGRPADPACYEDGHVSYQKLARTDLFRSGLRRVVEGSERMNIALMCAEKDPGICHRAKLVACELVELGMEVEHILATGEIETHRALMRRPRERRRSSKEDLFTTSEEPKMPEGEACSARREKPRMAADNAD